MKYVYTVWLRELSLPEDDPDFEWPACFLIDGASETSAQQWGDGLSQKHAQLNNQTVVRSTVEELGTTALPGLDSLPLVREGEESTDDEIGW
jgi:hypothetical protein